MIKKKKLKTLSTYLKHDVNIIKFLCKISKNIYNITIFCHSIFIKYKNEIYEILYEWICKKNITNIDEIDKKLQKIYQKYYNKYCLIKNDLDNNNKIIYKYIIKYINDNQIIVINNNFNEIKKTIIDNLNKNTNINYTGETKKELFIDIIDRILKSIYIKNFYRTKNQLINKKKLTITDKEFINQIKNDENIFNVDDIINYKSKIEKIINHKLKSNQNYISRFVYRHLNENEDKIPSDIIINIINKAFNGIHSYYALKQKGIICNKPKYLRKNGLYNLLFFDRSRKEIDNSTIRLTVGKYIADKYIEITKNSSLMCLNRQDKTFYKKYINKSIMKTIIKKQPKSKNYILNDKYIEKNNKNILNGYYISIPKPIKIKNFKIKMVEIVPVYDGHTFKINYIYEKPHNNLDNNAKDKLKNYLSIDLGMKNLITMYDPRGVNKIISGSYINSLNYYYNHKINYLKSRLKKCQNKNTSKRIRNLLISRFNKIDCYFNKLVKWFVNNYGQTKKKIIIGYNTNWKKGVNMGKENNRKFYQVPFCRLLNKLKNKMSKYGVEVIFTEESYTSKCDALSLEKICKHKKYNGKRIKRGLFSSSVNKLINADINGGINIMRKYLNKNGKELKKFKYKYICNPQKINIFSEAP